MFRTENVVEVKEAADRVFALAEDKAGFPRFMPHVLESREIREGARVAYRMAARMPLGFVSRWVSERTGTEPGRWASYRTAGFCRRMEGRWQVDPLPPGRDGYPRTRLTLTHEVDVGHPWLRRIVPLERIVRSCVEGNAQRMLESIRDRLEQGVDDVPGGRR
jgi:uncharacterized membrane protein